MKVQNPSENIDFGVSGLHHAVVKLTENLHVLELAKQIENHRHREAFQSDLQQNDSFNQFSAESKVMIREMGNVELFELCGTIFKSAMLRMPSLLESRSCLLHLWIFLQRK